MSIAAYIKEIGRGKEGARSLSATQAFDLFSQVLDGAATDLQVGAFCLAMRIKGETAAELDGFVRATHERCLPMPSALPSGSLGVVVLPSYNGARKLPNLTPLLAWTLAQRGAAVLVHGVSEEPTRISSAQVFGAAGLPVVHTSVALQEAWSQGLPAFMPIDTLCPPLARLLAVRWALGLRNPGHTVAKLINPFGSAQAQRSVAIQVVNHTHPEYGESLAAYLQSAQANALLMRGTEGEPVADPRRQPRFDVFVQGQRVEALSRAPLEGVLTQLPDLPAGREADVTAQYIREVIDGHRALPESIHAQADCLIQALKVIKAD